jgi:hypothetical protein
LSIVVQSILQMRNAEDGDQVDQSIGGHAVSILLPFSRTSGSCERIYAEPTHPPRFSSERE